MRFLGRNQYGRFQCRLEGDTGTCSDGLLDKNKYEQERKSIDEQGLVSREDYEWLSEGMEYSNYLGRWVPTVLKEQLEDEQAEYDDRSRAAR